MAWMGGFDRGETSWGRNQEGRWVKCLRWEWVCQLFAGNVVLSARRVARNYTFEMSTLNLKTNFGGVRRGGLGGLTAD